MTIFTRFFKDKRRWLLWWTVGTVGFVVLSIAFYPAFKEFTQFDEQFKDAPEGVRALLGGQGGISLTSAAGFLHSQVFAQSLPILLIIFATGLGSRAIAGAEGDGTLELLLANPVTRRRVAIERYLTVVAQVVVLSVAATIVVVGFSPLFQLKGIGMLNLLGAHLAATCFGIVFASIAFAAGAVTGRRGIAIAAASAVAAAGFVVFGLVSGGILEPLRFITPWWWYVSRNMVAFGMPPEAVWAPLGVSAALLAIGVFRFERRDLRSSD